MFAKLHGLVSGDDAPRAPGRDLLLPASLGASLAWAYWPTLAGMSGRWGSDPRYSHGYLVPIFALWLLHRRGGASVSWQSSEEASGRWWGVALLAVGAAARLAGARYYVNWIEAASLLPSIAGVLVVLGGRRVLRASWPSIAFLVFMIPLPYRLEVALGRPLQRIAATASAATLQTLGLPAIAEGNVIVLPHARIGVVEACNGLGMLFTFTAMATAVALVVRRPAVERALIALGSIPISLLANVTRITATGLLGETFGGGVADSVYHDLAGWLMMPLALLLLWGEVWLLGLLLVDGTGPQDPEHRGKRTRDDVAPRPA